MSRMPEQGDTVVFDIETSNFFTSPEVGWGNFDAISISVVGMYSYQRDQYLCVEPGEYDVLAEWFGGATRLVGFASNRYDTPVLNLLFRRKGSEAGGPLDLWRKQRVDLLEEIELATGKRVSLSKLAQANLGEDKTGKGHEAIALFEQGRMEELKAYCLKDVELTKRLYDKFVDERAFLVPEPHGDKVKTITFDAPSLQLPLF